MGYPEKRQGRWLKIWTETLEKDERQRFGSRGVREGRSLRVCIAHGAQPAADASVPTIILL